MINAVSSAYLPWDAIYGYVFCFYLVMPYRRYISWVNTKHQGDNTHPLQSPCGIGISYISSCPLLRMPSASNISFLRNGYCCDLHLFIVECRIALCVQLYRRSSYSRWNKYIGAKSTVIQLVNQVRGETISTRKIKRDNLTNPKLGDNSISIFSLQLMSRQIPGISKNGFRWT